MSWQKKFSGPLTQSKALYCFVINQLATPGLGTLIGKRLVSGICQLMLSVSGFFLIIVWMFQLFWRMTLQQTGEQPPPAHNGLGKWGAIFFGTAWVWALFSSIGLLREAREIEARENSGVPPIIQ